MLSLARMPTAFYIQPQQLQGQWTELSSSPGVMEFTGISIGKIAVLSHQSSLTHWHTGSADCACAGQKNNSSDNSLGR